MAEHDVGVFPLTTHTVKGIDSDSFGASPAED